MPRVKVREVIDGDTFKIERGKSIRLADVNAPERGTRGAAAAKHALEDLVAGKTISFQPVGQSYGRIVAKVKVGSKSVNQDMRRKGYK